MENKDELSENSGLLKKARNILAQITPRFEVWAKRSGFVRAAVMSPVETSAGRFYYVSDSYNMNAESMARFNKSEEFWTETISKTFEWQCFSADFNELDKFEQFFPESFFSRISKIFFLPFGNEKTPFIFVTAELLDEEDLNLQEASLTAVHLKNIKEFQDEENRILSKFESNIEKGLEISKSRLFILSLKNWIESAIKEITFENNDQENAVVEGIANAARVSLMPLIRSPNCINSGKNGEIKIVLYAKEDPDEELAAHHISRTLETFLGKAPEEKEAVFLPAGICPNKKGTIMFLTKE